ncbi:MAG: diguanylate cyclase [Bacillota bacterium]|nr:diguanylate cyclase [Bacillota bacterium]
MDLSTIDLVRIIDLNIFSIIVLAMMLVAVLKNIQDRHQAGTRLFAMMIVMTMMLAIFDILGWIWEGKPGSSAHAANLAANLLLYLFAPFPAASWLLYVFYQLSGSMKRTLHVLYAVLAVIAVNWALTFTTPSTGWFFSIDGANNYTRGPLFLFHVLIPYGFLLITFILILSYKSVQEPAVHRSLLLFILPPLIGTVLQSLFFGLSLTWASITVSILIIFLRIQNRGLFTDSLTGTYNRRHFERIINSKISRAGLEGFSVIIADLDAFKQINDQFGHDVGDEALMQTVHLFRKTLRQDDLIARFGGDEFYILLDITDPVILKEKVRRITEVFDRFSAENRLPYRLAVSMGAAVYGEKGRQSAEDYLRYVDQLMYQTKTANKQARSSRAVHSRAVHSGADNTTA